MPARPWPRSVPGPESYVPSSKARSSASSSSPPRTAASHCRLIATAVPIDGAAGDRRPLIADLDRLAVQDCGGVPVGASQGPGKAVLDFVMVVGVHRRRAPGDEMLDQRRAADIMGEQPFQIGGVPGAAQGGGEGLGRHLAPQRRNRVLRLRSEPSKTRSPSLVCHTSTCGNTDLKVANTVRIVRWSIS